MKLLVKVFVVVILFALLGAVIGGLATQKSYVLLAVGNTTMETSLWFAVAVILSFFVVFGGGALALFKGLSTSKKFLNWRETRRRQSAAAQTKDGFLQLAQGSWGKAEDLLKASFRNDEEALLGYLGAARAANEQGKNDERDAYLKRAKELNPSAAIAIDTSRASMQLDKGQFPQAAETLSAISGKDSRHPFVLSLMQRAYLGSNDWSSLRQLMPLLRQFKVLDEDSLNRLEKDCYIALMTAVGSKRKKDEDATPYVNDLVRLLEEAPASLHRSASVLCAYARALLALGEEDRAANLLSAEMPAVWSDEAVTLYGQIKSTEPAKQLIQAENWLPGRDNNEALLLALGRLALSGGLPEKAKGYLEQSLSVRKSAEVYAELGRVFSVMGDDKAGNEAFVLSLELAQ
jgi:HemY protein